MSGVDIRKLVNVYEFTTILPGSKQEIKFKPLVSGQMKKLLTYEGETDPGVIEQALDDLMTSAVVSDDFNMDDIFLQDRFFLLVELRKKTKGNTYSFTYKCPECDTDVLMTLDLGTLTMKQPQEVSPIVKINDQLSVKMRKLTRGDQKKAYDLNPEVKGGSRIKRAADISTSLYALACESAILNDGTEITDVSYEDKYFIFDNLADDALKALEDYYSKSDFGLDFRFDFKCLLCKKPEKIEIPLSDFFA